ncbi:FkbM family methyltransferase [Streptomyces sp. NBC_01511]
MFRRLGTTLTRWMQGRLRPGDTFVDVGANIGYYSVLAAQLVEARGRVVAIEASPGFRQKLQQQVRLNGCGNVRAGRFGEHGANSIVPYEGPAESSFEIEALPLPEILTAEEIASARVIRIDSAAMRTIPARVRSAFQLSKGEGPFKCQGLVSSGASPPRASRTAKSRRGPARRGRRR